MKQPDVIRIQHMLAAANDALQFSKGRSRKDLENDRILALAIIKCIEIIGEAASKVSNECRDKYPDIPWLDIINMRNRMIHAYHDVNLDIVWATIIQDLPPLSYDLQNLLASKSDSE